MPKNKIVAKNNRPGSNKATGRDYSYDKDYQASPSRVKYREELNKEAHQRGVYGKRASKGLDLSHTTVNGKLVLEKSSTNRARNSSNGKSTKKKI